MLNTARAGVGGLPNKTALFMKKEQLINEMKSTRHWNTFSKHRLWKEAFRLYGQTFGVNLSLNCDKCFVEVKEWLLK